MISPGRKWFACAGLLVLFCRGVYAQDIGGGIQPDGKRVNSIHTAVPFLMIAPDSRAGGMGDAGVATAPDVNAMHWNPAKYAFLDDRAGVSLAFTPWLKKVADDINLAYLVGYYRLDERQTLAASVKFFSFGEVIFTDAQANELLQFNPSEYSLDAAYIRKFSESFSMGMALRYVRSGIGAGNYNGTDVNPGNAVAVDLGLYFRYPVVLAGNNAAFSYGVHLSNIGTKMQYGTTSYFLPMNLRIGGALDLDLNERSKFGLALDLNKLLAPTDPLRDNEGRIVRGKDPDRSIAGAVFGSFSDAPGGFREELREINVAAGAEYWYDNLLALRTGFFYSHPTKGDQQYFTLGAGIRYTAFGFDFAYLIPTGKVNPLENTLRFTLGYRIPGNGKSVTGPDNL